MIHALDVRRAAGSLKWVAGCAVAVTAASLVLRVPSFGFGGPRTQVAFNAYAFERIWAYSDVASLYFRDHLWSHPAPYFDYRLEYPVVTGAFIWLAGIFHRSVGLYLSVTSAMLAACAAACAGALGRLPRGNAWLFALSPTLLLYAVFNWDLLAIALMLGAIVAFLADRFVLCGVLLALAVWAKLFPLAFLAVMLLLLLRRRDRSGALSIGAAFAVASAIVNLPAAVIFDHGPHLRSGWTYFFTFQRDRHPGLSIWSLSPSHLSTSDVNTASLVLGIAGCLAALAIAYRASRAVPAEALVVPAGLALVAWVFAVNKVDSPQYTLWIIALLAACGAPAVLVVALGAFDLAYYASDFTSLFLATHGSPLHDVFHDRVVHPMVAVREAFLLGIFGWCLWAMRRRVAPALS